MSDNGCDLGYFSHFPALATAIANTEGPVLELGAGWGSTPLVHYQAYHRERVTVDMDKEWLDKFAKGYASTNHRFVYVEYEPEHEEGTIRNRYAAWLEWGKRTIPTRKWGLAFVDCAPGEVRVPLIKLLKGRADIIIAHDTEADEPGAGGNYGWRELNGLFKYAQVMKRMRPWTTIYSDYTYFPTLETVDAQ